MEGTECVGTESLIGGYGCVYAPVASKWAVYETRLYNWLKIATFASIKLIKNKIMATTIKTSPELWGESAKEFDSMAENNGKKPTPHLSQEEERKLREIFRRSREFVFPWQKKS